MQRFVLYIKYALLIIVFMVSNGFLLAKDIIIPDSLQTLRFQIDSIPFSMQRVEGGVFIMGGTREQHKEVIYTEMPTHTVALDAYYIGHTEVTQALWQVIMQEYPIISEAYNPNHPITNISWNDCQEFIRRLDSITGLPFRLPTEAEWEFAARGGNNSKSYRFAGSNEIDSVGWGLSNSGFRKHSVGQKMPNELGLYDMTGNVSEWCEDWYAPYYLGTEPNPHGPKEGTEKIIRGGSYDNCQANSHISFRQFLNPSEVTQYCGFRLALTLPNEPTLQVINEEPDIVKRIKIQNIRIKMLYVHDSLSYYISHQPVSWRLWRKIMNEEGIERWSEPVTTKTEKEWNIFLEKCRKQSNLVLSFATEEEISIACSTKIIENITIQPKKKKYWEQDTKSIKRRRKTNQKAQKWADLVGIRLKNIADPTLELYTNEKNNQPKWLVIRIN